MAKKFSPKESRLQHELIGRLAVLRADCDLIIDVIRRYGAAYDNLSLFESHIELYREVVVRVKAELGEGA